MKKIDLAIKEALITGTLADRHMGIEPRHDFKVVFVTGRDDESRIPSFIHPHLIQKFKDQDYLVVDVRDFRAVGLQYESDREFEAAIRNKSEYALIKSRAVLNALWITEDTSRIRGQFAFAGSVFAGWLSQAIGSSYALDYQAQLQIMAVSIYYYHTLFQQSDVLEGNERDIAAIHTIKATKLPATEVYALFDKLGPMNGIENYCTEVAKAIENVRLKDFNVTMLLTLIRNTWYGTHSKDILSVALEHPPTWIAVVYATLTERSYKSSSLYKIVEMQGKRGNADEFRLNFLRLLKENVVGESIDDRSIEIKAFEE